MPDDWYERDSEWYAQHFQQFTGEPMANRLCSTGNLRFNLEHRDIKLMRVWQERPLKHRLMLQIDTDTRCARTQMCWLWRTFIPYHGYLDVVKRVGCLIQHNGKVFGHDSMPEILRIHKMRLLTDHVALMTMFVRWRDIVAARKQARVAELTMCLLRAQRFHLLQVVLMHKAIHPGSSS